MGRAKFNVKFGLGLVALAAMQANIGGCGQAMQMATQAGQAVSQAGSGIATQSQQSMQASYTFGSSGPQVAASGQQNGQTHSLWPVDTAIVPLPTVFLATPDNTVSYADLPVSTAQDVVPDDGSSNKFTVEVPQISEIGATQEGPTLCWAACTQTLLRQQQIQVNQQALAQQFVPDTGDDDQTAGIGVVTRALNPDLAPQVEQKGAIPISLVSVTTDQMIRELMAGHLCMVGLVEDKEANVGHACVICGATFAQLKSSPASSVNLSTVGVNPNAPQPTLDSQSLQSNLHPTYGLYEVELFDPEPNTGTRKLTAQQFTDQVAFITSHQISHDMLEDALRGNPNGPVDFNRVLVVKSKNKFRARMAVKKLEMRPGSKPKLPDPNKPAQPGQRTSNGRSTNRQQNAQPAPTQQNNNKKNTKNAS